jgi:hypothetical protein
MLDSIHDGKDFKGPGCPPPYCYEVPLPALVELAKKSEAFAGVSPRSLRVAVHQIVKKLRALRMVKTKLKPGKCGPVLWVQNRRNAVIAQKHQNPVAAQGFLAEKTTVTVSTIVVEVTPPSLPNLAPNPELASGTKTNAGFNIIPCPNRPKSKLVWTVPTPAKAARMVTLQHGYACTAATLDGAAISLDERAAA